MKNKRNDILLVLFVVIFAIYDCKSFLLLLLEALLVFFVTKKSYIHKKPIFVITIITLLIPMFIKKASILDFFGISYANMKLISFAVDSYQNQQHEENIRRFLLYILFFPTLFIGPINDYDEFVKSYNYMNNVDVNANDGLLRIVFGLFAKIVVANRINMVISNVVINEYEGLYILISLFLYTLYLYFDFSGGINIVIGISEIFGFKLSENFKQPLLSKSPKEFWNRWHIGLSNFLKKYIYIPLGGNKKHKTINVIITFVVSGLWHGFEYITWGLYNGLLVSFMPTIKNKSLANIITYIVISFGWIFFMYPSNIESLSKFVSIFTSIKGFSLITLFETLKLYDIAIIVMGTIILFFLESLTYKINKHKINSTNIILIVGFSLIIILLLGKYGIGFDASSFVYGRF